MSAFAAGIWIGLLLGLAAATALAAVAEGRGMAGSWAATAGLLTALSGLIGHALALRSLRRTGA